jgi:predicted glycosyltransferase
VVGRDGGPIFAYCHDSVGIGHLYRTLSICERVGGEFPNATFLVATGTPYIGLFEQLPHVDFLKLPALAKREDRTYAGKFLSMSPKQIIECRSALLKDAVAHFRPRLVLVDKAPLGVCRELVPSLEWLRRHMPRTPIVFGMRDVEDSPEATIAEWARADIPSMLQEFFDEIWVYGMRDVFDVTAEYALPPGVVSKMRFMGYVVRGPCQHAPPSVMEKPYVLVTVGGGTDGDLLLTPFLEEAASRVSRLGFRSIVVGGPDLEPGRAKDLRKRARNIEGLEWIDFEPCLSCRIRDARLVVSMGGYNTLCAIAQRRRPALIVPRTYPRKEQFIRAQLWSRRGAVEVHDPEEPSPAALADHVCEMLSAPNVPTNPDLDLGGLDRVCVRFQALWNRRTPRAAAVSL